MVNLLSTQVQSRTISLHAIPPIPSPPGDIHPELCNEVFMFVFSLLQSSLITCVYIPKYYIHSLVLLVPDGTACSIYIDCKMLSFELFRLPSVTWM